MRDEGWSVTARSTVLAPGDIEGQRNIALQESQTNPSRTDQAARALLIGLLCAVLAFVCLRGATGAVADPDVGWHLRTGQWILQHHAFPRTDPFSRVSGGSAWQAYSWLFELILLKLYGWMNLQGLMIFTAAMMALIAAAVYHMMSRLQADFTQRAVLTIAVMFCLSRMSTPRPWLFTILFFALEMDILMHVRQTGKSRELLWLPLLFALWANVHIQFVDGLLVLGIAATEPLLERWWKSGTKGAPARNLWLALGACVAAVCLNPYGPGSTKWRGNWVCSRAAISRRCWRCRFGRWAILPCCFLPWLRPECCSGTGGWRHLRALMLAMAARFRSAAARLG